MKRLKNIFGIIILIVLINIIFKSFSDYKNISDEISFNTLNVSAVDNKDEPNPKIRFFQNPDFTIAAENTINSVVHVKILQHLKEVIVFGIIFTVIQKTEEQ